MLQILYYTDEETNVTKPKRLIQGQNIVRQQWALTGTPNFLTPCSGPFLSTFEWNIQLASAK